MQHLPNSVPMVDTNLACSTVGVASGFEAFNS